MLRDRQRDGVGVRGDHPLRGFAQARPDGGASGPAEGGAIPLRQPGEHLGNSIAALAASRTGNQLKMIEGEWHHSVGGGSHSCALNCL